MAEQREASNPVTIGRITLFCAPLWLTGLWTLIGGIRTNAVGPLVAGIAMFVAGVLPIYLVIVSIRLQPQRKALYKEIRAIPAEWKPEWSAGRLADQTVETASVINAMTILLTGVSLLCGFFAYGAVRQGAWAGLFMLVVPLIVAGFVVARIRAGVRRRRFGKSELFLEENPARIGKTMRADLIVEKLRPEELSERRFRVHVTCVRRKTWTEMQRGSRRERVDSSVLWQGRSDIPGSAAQLKEDGLWLPIAIETPRDQQATNDALESDRIYWQLEASSQLPGIDYYSRFEVPVFV
jgi:hypothetical protein